MVATAQPAAAEWFITPFIGIKFAGTTNTVDLEQGAGNTKLTVGATAGFLTDGLFGVEADFGYSPRFFERSSGSDLVARSQVVTLMGNVIIAAPRSLTGLSLRPYVSGGGGLLRLGVDDVLNLLSFDTNLFAINVGGGAIGGISNRSDLRFELRYFKNVSEGEDALGFGPTRISFWRANIGITVR